MFSNNTLHQRRIIVTGASSGIGRDAARLFAELGANVCLISRRFEVLESVRESLPRADSHMSFQLDLHDTSKIVESMREIAERWGKISGMFHAAGVESLTPIKVLRDANAQQLLQGTVVASLMLAKGFCHSSVLDGSSFPSIVFMSSVSARRGHPTLATYSAAKAAVEGATRSLAAELAPNRIRVNAIAAGAVDTEMHQRTLKGMNQAMIDSYRIRHPLGFGEPRDVSNAAAFLISPLSKWMTGSVIDVDGGYLCI